MRQVNILEHETRNKVGHVLSQRAPGAIGQQVKILNKRLKKNSHVILQRAKILEQR